MTQTRRSFFGLAAGALAALTTPAVAARTASRFNTRWFCSYVAHESPPGIMETGKPLGRVVKSTVTRDGRGIEFEMKLNADGVKWMQGMQRRIK